MKRLIGLILVLSLLLTGCTVGELHDCSDHLPGECPECAAPAPGDTPTPSPDEGGNSDNGAEGGDSNPDTDPPADDNTNGDDTNPPAGDDNTNGGDDTNPPAGDDNTEGGDDINPPAGDDNTEGGDDTNPPAGDNNEGGDNGNTDNGTDDVVPPSGDEQDPPVHSHTFSTTVTKPTCENDGYTTYTCSGCDYSYTADEVDAKGHNYKSTVTKPTCEAEGYTTYTCAICDDSYVADRVDAKGHSYKSTVTKPTCDAEGYTTYTCTECNYSYTADKVDALGHSYKPTVTGPTCTEGGYTTYTCSTCGDSYTGNNVSSLGHSYKSTVTKPTCDAEGYTTYTCTECNYSYTADKVDALGHSYKPTVTAPTCTAEGYTTHTCSVCGDSYKDSQTAAKGHSYKSTVTKPTCDAEGYTTHVCESCSYTYIDSRTSATGHTWRDATTEAPKTCTTCGATEGEKLPSSSSGFATSLYVNYINVGQGDSILIKVGDCDILIDGGTAVYGSTVSNYLKSKGVDDVELMINTHPDADHCGGLTQVLKDFKVEALWAPSKTATSATYKNFAAAVKSEGLTAKVPSVGTVYSYGEMMLSVLYNGSGASSSNDSSIVVMLQYGNHRFLFTGDISSNIETKLVNNGTNLKCDVLKVAHHGSKYSSSSAFLKATAAKYGVICVGKNSYGHPTDTTLSNLKSAGISVYRTDKDGNVVFSTNGQTLTIPGGTTVSGGSGGSSSSGSSSSGSSSGTSTTDYFIGNLESDVFHLPTCGHLPDESKQCYLYDYWFIVNCIGYKPCGICMKDYEP